MACWREGRFEFHANVSAEHGQEASVGLPIDAALLEAARLVDEGRRHRGTRLPRRARLCAERLRVERGDPALTKVESRILELAAVGMTVSRLLDAIQEPDVLIERAILALVESGALRLEEAA